MVSCGVGGRRVLRGGIGCGGRPQQLDLLDYYVSWGGRLMSPLCQQEGRQSRERERNKDKKALEL